MLDLIEEHNAPDNSDDEKLVKYLDAKAKEAESYRDNFYSKAPEYEKFYDGEQWPNGSKKPVDNVIFQIIESMVPSITDGMPGSSILARNPEKEEGGKQLQAHINYVYEFNNLHLKIVGLVRESLISGTPYFYVSYDPHADDGQGMTIIKTLGWRQVAGDPMASDWDGVGYLKIKVPTRVDELKKMFPKKAKLIKAQKISFDGAGNAVNPASETHHSSGYSSDQEEKYSVNDAAFLEEHWFKDYTMVPITEEETAAEIAEEEMQLMKGEYPELSKYEDHNLHITQHYFDLTKMVAQAFGITQEQVNDELIEQAKEHPEIGRIVSMWVDHIELHQTYKDDLPPEKPKYPDFWRKVLKIGKLIVEKDDEPFVPAGKVPVVPIYCYKRVDQLYGFGDVKNIIDDQKIINEMDAALVSNVRLLGNAQVIMDANCGIDPSEITNEPGKVYEPKQGTRFEIVTPPTIGNDFREIRLERKEASKEKSGQNNAALGVSPGAGSSGKLVRLLIEQSNGRIRLKARLLESYSSIRLGQITGAFTEKFAVARKIRNTDETGQYVYIDYNPGDVENGKYDYVTTPGTTSGPDKESIQTDLKEALLAGLIDYPTYIKATNPPWKRTVLAALQEKDEAAAMTRQLQEDNLKMRAKFMPNTLTPEEVKIIEQMQLEQARQVNV